VIGDSRQLPVRRDRHVVRRSGNRKRSEKLHLSRVDHEDTLRGMVVTQACARWA
jgi:hypothetical protein